MGPATPWFPVVGVAIGAIVGAVYLVASEVVASPIAALLVVTLGALITGAFHEDGLADTFDSFGGYTQERRLEIMRDSRIGTFGTLALVLATGLKVAALSQLDGGDGLIALVAAHALGRAGALGVMATIGAVRDDGLAPTGDAVPRKAIAAMVAGCVLAAAAIGPSTAGGAGSVVIAAIAMSILARRHLGGTTGDLLGATEQVGEISVLIVIGEMAPRTGWLWA